MMRPELQRGQGGQQRGERAQERELAVIGHALHTAQVGRQTCRALGQLPQDPHITGGEGCWCWWVRHVGAWPGNGGNARPLDDPTRETHLTPETREIIGPAMHLGPQQAPGGALPCGFYLAGRLGHVFSGHGVLLVRVGGAASRVRTQTLRRSQGNRNPCPWLVL